MHFLNWTACCWSYFALMLLLRLTTFDTIKKHMIVSFLWKKKFFCLTKAATCVCCFLIMASQKREPSKWERKEKETSKTFSVPLMTNNRKQILTKIERSAKKANNINFCVFVFEIYLFISIHCKKRTTTTTNSTPSKSCCFWLTCFKIVLLLLFFLYL